MLLPRLRRVLTTVHVKYAHTPPLRHYSLRTSHCLRRMPPLLIRTDRRLTTSWHHEKTVMPTEAYDGMVARGEITRDNDQLRVVQRLNAMYHTLVEYNKTEPPSPPVLVSNDDSSESGLFSRLFGSDDAPKKETSDVNIPTGVPKGLYIFGTPGTGKTFLMDLLYDCQPMKLRKRVHFNKFMLDVHDRIHKWRQGDGRAHQSDPIPPLADALSREARLLCFDEFQVTDIVDAMLLRRLFGALWERGVVVIATSNRHPTELYLNGLQRKQVFLPFLDLLLEQNEVIDLNSGLDYRQEGTRLGITYFHPTDANTTKDMEAAWQRVVGGTNHSCEIDVMAGRKLEVPVSGRGCAKFVFPDLMEKPLGAADYNAITQHYHTVFLTDIPHMTIENRNELRRFILFVDEMYQSKIRLVCHAERPSSTLFTPPQRGGSNYDEVFAFERCDSRLQEMQSKEYLDARAAERRLWYLSRLANMSFHDLDAEDTRVLPASVLCRAFEGRLSVRLGEDLTLSILNELSSLEEEFTEDAFREFVISRAKKIVVSK